MHQQISLRVEILTYLLVGCLVMKKLRGLWREAAFGILNVAAVYFFWFYKEDRQHALAFAAYVALIALQYAALRVFVGKGGWLPWIAFSVPLLALVLVRYVPTSSAVYSGSVLRYGPLLIGLSYMAFRSSRLVLEVRSGSVPVPGFWKYAGFCFFVPTLTVGPISPLSQYQRAFGDQPPVIDWGRAALRILIGFVKYKFIGNVCFQLIYANLLFDDHFHPWVDLQVAAIFYYLYLYCNFSGFCDMAIGLAGLMGFPVDENFDEPIAARNLKDFWNRWHITLSQYMRDVVFTPLSKWLVGVLGPKSVNHAVALTIVVVFLLVGIWHGVGWNYAAFGAAHALGFVTHHYYTIGLKRWLGRDGFKAYNANPWIHAAAVVITFCYCAATFFLFANTFPQMKEIFSHLR